MKLSVFSDLLLHLLMFHGANVEISCAADFLFCLISGREIHCGGNCICVRMGKRKRKICFVLVFYQQEQS